MTSQIPPPIGAVLRSLRFDAEEPLALPGGAWDESLAFTDLARLTLVWRSRLVASGVWPRVPDAVRRRLDQNWADNIERQRRIREASSEVESRFESAGVEFVALKGLSHAAFVEDPRQRVQYDLDFFCPGGAVYRARDALLSLGYESRTELEGFPVDHLPAMVRKTGWQWRGNFFDPDYPPPIDLHFQLWNPQIERLPAPGVEDFWIRRSGHSFDLADQLGYAALHAVRHLLRGRLTLYHIYEIAYFLRQHAEDAAFWARWREIHPEGLRLLESIPFGLAHHYFGSPAFPAQRPVEDWLNRHAWAPVEGMFRSNKRELLLHLSLLPSNSDRWKVLRRRLFPERLPKPGGTVHVPDENVTPLLLVRKWISHFSFLIQRLTHHARVLLPTLGMLARWSWRRR